MQEALLSVMKDRTTIVVAHRLSTVISADHIVVLDDGLVLEEGSHRDLLQNENGVYARFHRFHSEEGLGLIDDNGEAAGATMNDGVRLRTRA